MDYIKVAAVSPALRVADVSFNLAETLKLLKTLHGAHVKVAVFPEMSLTGYTIGDMVLMEDLLHAAEEALEKLTESTLGKDMVVIVGLPLRRKGLLYNCAAVLFEGRVLGIVPKTHIPNYGEFYEHRWFTPYGKHAKGFLDLPFQENVPFGTLVFDAKAYRFGVEICEDLFAPVAPSTHLALHGAELLFNLSASNELVGKSDYRRDLVRVQSAKTLSAYVYASAGVGESTTDLVFSGHLLLAEYGSVLQENQRFQLESDWIAEHVDVTRIRGERLRNTTFRMEASNLQETPLTVSFRHSSLTLDGFHRPMDPHPFVPENPVERKRRAEEIFAIQAHGLAKRLRHTGLQKSVIGISGGLDSTLALLVVRKAHALLHLPMENIIAITMPGFGTTDRTYGNAVEMIQELGADFREIPIREAALLHMRDIGHDPDLHDSTYENVQARERTQILMDIANKEGGLVVGTGDLSELALGWCTYNGDHMSMYGVNASIPKTLVRTLVRHVLEMEENGRLAAILADVLDTPVSPELLPRGRKDELVQKTEEIIGPYELHDFFLYHHLRYGASMEKIRFMAEKAFAGRYGRDAIEKWLGLYAKRFVTQQFKRSAMPDGPKVGSIALSPRGDLRMPSDAAHGVFTKNL